LAIAGVVGTLLGPMLMPGSHDWFGRTVVGIVGILVWAAVTFILTLLSAGGKLLAEGEDRLAEANKKVKELQARQAVATLHFVTSGKITYLRVDNVGPGATFWAKLLVTEQGNDELDEFALWDKSYPAKLFIARNESYRLKIARYHPFPTIDRWEVFCISNDQSTGKIFQRRRSSSESVDDDMKDRNSAWIVITIQLFAEPELRDGPITRRIHLIDDKAIDTSLGENKPSSDISTKLTESSISA